MDRTQILKGASKPTHHEVIRKTAIHEAGHAAAICFGNKQKGLPPVFFQILLQPLNSEFQSSRLSGNPSHSPIAKVKGGRLIHTLPSSLDEITKDFSTGQKLAYQRAFEADMINLLVGPLAEANYVALRDGELINPRLVKLNALQNYGGLSDLAIVNEYLGRFIDCDELRERKMSELFLAAYSFIDERRNWLAITALADYILAIKRNIIEYDEIINVLETWAVAAGRANTQGIANSRQ